MATATSEQIAWVQRVLEIRATASQSGGAPPKGVVAYRKALLNLEATRAQVTGDTRALADQIAERMPDQAELANRVADAIEEFCEHLGDSVDAAMNALGDGRAERNASVKQEVQTLIGTVSSDRLIAHVDKNPVQPMKIAAQLVAALQRVSETIV